jgi:DNA helicase-2/ATP-dependent DNA helicase PcrA
MTATERQLTDEQRQVIEHDPGAHATVLAVAGAGKTTTMVYRIRHLIERLRVPPRGIRAVMFNRSARDDFQEKLESVAGREGPPCLADVRVQTLHGLGNDIVRWGVGEGLFQERTLLSEEDGNLQEFTHEVVETFLRRHPPNFGTRPDAEEVLDAIHAWKAMMTPPEHARHATTPAYPLIYQAFEQERVRRNLLTYDDMIFEAVRLLEEQSPRGDQARKTLVNRLAHIIVDEFQDVNYARQQLVWLLAGDRARVMVVGDDDQCVYEWQGARAAYLTRVFGERCRPTPHTVYHLSQSFRFGPVIAQTAANVIAHNTDRAPKALVAGDLHGKGSVQVCVDRDGTQGGQPACQVERLLGEGVPPKEVVVLVRNYAQACETQAGLLVRGIPHLVENGRHFIRRHPVEVALDYLRLANGIRSPLCGRTAQILTRCIHRPERYIRRREFAAATDSALNEALTLNAFLRNSTRLTAAGIEGRPLIAITDFCCLLEEAANLTAAHKALDLLCGRIDFASYFSSFQAPGQAASSMAVLESFVTLLRELGAPLAGVDSAVARLDSTRGQAKADCVLVTSVFKAKGLEWDYVIVPEAVEGQLPDLRASENFAEDGEHPERSLDRTECVESERRLFYVAVTRARKGVFIYAKDNERQKVSRFVHEALVGQTTRAVTALQGIIETGLVTPEAMARLREGATQEHLRTGLIEMLSAAMRSHAKHGAALGRTLSQVAAVRPHAFQYPDSLPRRAGRQQRADLGLPF